MDLFGMCTLVHLFRVVVSRDLTMAKKKTRLGKRRRRSASDANQSDLSSCAGQGALVGSDPHHSRADSRLIERAIRQRWPIPEEVNPELIDRQVEIAKGAD